ncbi:eukaryotic translation initiation factor 5B-like [Anneissia japonica]|uniref:eukaryotic translation initiation factor 5B-like n=1 Tax=Anneissia japonica TaxID=1529436 RepID=UPI001425972A|nr:eukaryotic translation initiation factor 5B-like [Anneissia japonica]
MGKPKKGKSNKERSSEPNVEEFDGADDSMNTDIKEKVISSKPSEKKGKKKNKKDWNEDDLLDDITELETNGMDKKDEPQQDTTAVEEEQKGGKKGKKQNKKKGLNEDDLLDDITELETNGMDKKDEPQQDTTAVEEEQKGGKKGKKQNKKKGFDVDDIADEIASLTVADSEPAVQEQPAQTNKGGKKSKKKKKKDFDPDDEDDLDNNEDGENTSTSNDQKIEKSETPAEETDDGPKIKTAAQKKAEKKERERKKKEQQRAATKANKEKVTENVEGSTATEKTEETEASTAKASVEADPKNVEDEEDTEDKDDKKKKKKKKKDKKEKGKDDDDKEKKKKPNKAMLEAMKVALKQKQEEEERLRLEEEERIRKEEEAFQKKLEQQRLEKEMKEREKQRKKEKIERLKKEGKWLTPAQRAARARAEAQLQAMRDQGIVIPTKVDEDKKPQRVNYGTRIKKKPKEVKVEDAPVVEESETSEEPSTADDSIIDILLLLMVNWTCTTPEVVSKEKDRTKSIEEEEDEEEEEEEEEESEEKEDEESDSEEESESEESSSSEEEESDDERTPAERARAKAMNRIQQRKEEAEMEKSVDKLRCPVVCVLGHVDTGKTKILDKIRHTNVQDGEAGGITQQIGATMVPETAIREQTKMCRQFAKTEMKFPGLLIIDTPGHESFSNLRLRGSSLCDIAILVVDIMHGLEPQTIESLNLLKSKKTPFIVALNKIDRLYGWKPSPHTDVMNTIKKQKKHTQDEFDERTRAVVTEFAEQGMNAALFYDNKDVRTYVSLVPTSAHSGDGMGNLISLIIELSQTMLAKRLMFSEDLQCTTMEVKSLPGLGTTIDAILVNGRLHEGDTIIVAGQEGPIVSQIRGLLMPQPLKELRVKNPYDKHKEVIAAQGVKILAKDMEKALAGMPLLATRYQDEVEIMKEEVAAALKEALFSIKLAERGVYVQASTLGSLEALLEFLRTSKIPYAGINIGPVHKKDVMKASVMLEHEPQYAVILAFDVKVEREAQELADKEGIKVFQADIIYHLFDKFMAHRAEEKRKKRDEFKHVAVFPCKIRVLPQHIFNSRDPIVMGVVVEAGQLKVGTPICVPAKEFTHLGFVTSLEVNHKPVQVVPTGQEVCIKIEPVPGDAPRLYGRHFTHEDVLVSKISRESIDAVKNYFREDMQKQDWLVMIELKKIFEII